MKLRGSAVAIAVGISALLTLSACSTASTTNSSSTGCANGAVNLTLLRAENNPPKDEFIKQYEKENKCVTVTVNEVPFGQLATKTQLIASQSNGPDLMEVDMPNTQTFAAAGLLLPLNKYLPSGYAADAVTATKQELTYENKTYSVGMAQGTAGLYYNETLLKASGITPPKALATAWTWKQALSAMEKCQQGPADNPTVFGLAPSAFGNGTAGNTFRDLMIIRSAGDPKAKKGSSAYNTYWGISSTGKTADGYLNTPEAIAAAKVYQSMYTGNTKVTSAEGLPNAFIDGKACFDLQTNYLAGGLTGTPPGFDWGITPVPYIKTPIVHTGDMTLAVSSKTKHPEEAAKFAIALGIGKEGLAWVAQNKSFPSIKSARDEKQFSYLKSGPLSILDQELVSWGHPRPPSTHFVEYDQLVSSALHDIALGANVKTTLDDTVSKVDATLAR